jgi:hypothetical protein
VDGTSPIAAADLPAAGQGAAAGLPADGPRVDEHLRAAVQHPALLRSGRSEERQVPIEGYDALTAEEVSSRLEGLSAEELREVRDYEERNQNRATVLEQLDRRIRTDI